MVKWLMVSMYPNIERATLKLNAYTGFKRVILMTYKFESKEEYWNIVYYKCKEDIMHLINYACLVFIKGHTSFLNGLQYAPFKRVVWQHTSFKEIHYFIFFSG